jgi:quercetin dioxygenase-like cupin family protein
MRERIKGNTLVARDEGDDANGVLIKLYGEETNGAISIIEQPFEPGFLLPPHVHNNDVWLYVLEGEMHARVGDEVVRATPGCWVLKPRRIPHTMWNAGPRAGTAHRAVHAGGVRALLQGLRRPVAPRADRARRTEPPWRAARHPLLQRLDPQDKSRL